MNIHSGTIEAKDDPLVLGTDPVPARYYYDPEWYELERRAVFMRSWLNVGHVCELPENGSFFRREIEFANASILVIRGKDGAIKAFHNACTHRGTQLVQEAAGKKTKFSCPYHMWTFGTDGALLSAPDFERFYIEKEDCALKQVALGVCGGLIFVNFDPRQALEEYLGPMAATLESLPVAQATTFHEYVYDINANWKLTYDNFQENYHLRFIHPRTGQLAIGEENPFGYPVEYGFSGPHRSQTLWKNPNPGPVPPTLGFGYGKAAQLAAGDGTPFAKTDFKLFPALHVVGLPPAQMYTHTHWPLGYDRTRGIIRMYWTKPADRASRLFTRELGAMAIRDVLSEDRHAVESAQHGLASGAVDRLNMQDHEMLLRHLYEEVAARVASYLADQGST